MCVGECSWGHRTHTHTPLRMHMNTQPHLPCTVLWYMYIAAEAHVYTPSVYLGRVFSRRAHYVHAVSMYSPVMHACIPKTWFLIRRRAPGPNAPQCS